MAKIIILGSSNAVSSKTNENAHMVIMGGARMILVDCPGKPVLRLEEAGLDFNRLTDIIITHFHPDHVSGLPLLLMDMWLMGRKDPIDIYGLSYTLDRVEAMMDLYSWSKWPDFYPVHFHRVPDIERSLVLDCADFRVSASPVCHLIPNMGLRIDIKEPVASLVYSSDTEPCPAVIRLSEGAKTLIHEAAGAHVGHSSAAQAGEIAAAAGVEELYLIHYPTGKFLDPGLLAEARGSFKGAVQLATDLQVIDL
jgi:ribonuclease Z